MLARRLTTILPAMTLAEAIETMRIHSIAGRTGDRTAVVTNRRDRSSLCSSIATRTGNGSYDFAIREWCENNCAGVDVGKIASMADGTGGDESLSVWSDRPSREHPYLSADECEEIEESLATIHDRISAVQALRQQRYSGNDLFRDVYMLSKHLRAHGRLDGGEHQRRAV